MFQKKMDYYCDLRYEKYIAPELGHLLNGVVFSPSTITTVMTDPPRVGSKATEVTPDPQVVVVADCAAASGLT